ncbi:caspase-9 [Liasis olivaceus]
MEEEDRRRLLRARVRLVQELRVEPLWEPLLRRGLFSRDMLEEIQRAGTRRDQARQLVTDLQTRGRRALPDFVLCLRDAGQSGLAALLSAAPAPPDARPARGPGRPGGGREGRAGRSLGAPARGRPLWPRRWARGGGCRGAVASRGCAAPRAAAALPSALPREERGGGREGRGRLPAGLRPSSLRSGDSRVPAPRGRGRRSPPVLAQTLPLPPPPPRFFGVSRLAAGSVEENPKGDSEMVYLLNSDPCGYCLIINNVTFDPDTELKCRVGSNIDCQRLEKRFRALHFEVLTKEDLTAEEIAQELQRLARRDHSALDCCVVVVLSHGCESYHIQFPGAIFGTDGQRIAVQKVVSCFNGFHCPSLRGKPKLFFIQACGGEERDEGFQVDADTPEDRLERKAIESDATPFQGPGGDCDELDATASLPTDSDILVCYPTFPGCVSWRDRQTGSWFIEALDQVLDQYAHLEDLPSILTKVGNIVSAKVAGSYKQMPGYFNFLRKKFFFKV